MNKVSKNSVLENLKASEEDKLEVVWEYEVAEDSEERILKVFEILLGKKKEKPETKNSLDKC